MWRDMFCASEEERSNLINQFYDKICPENTELTKDAFTSIAGIICNITEYGPIDEMDEDTKPD